MIDLRQLHATVSPLARLALLGTVIVLLLAALSGQGAMSVISRHPDIFPVSSDAAICSACHDGSTTSAVGRVNGLASTRFCQSCHDGILSGNDTTGRLTATLAITGERRSVHPVSVSFTPGGRAEERVGPRREHLDHVLSERLGGGATLGWRRDLVRWLGLGLGVRVRG